VQCRLSRAAPASEDNDADALREAHEEMWRIVEERILPPGWGRSFLRGNCVAEGDALLAAELLQQQGSFAAAREDPYTRKARLEAFFQGLTGAMGRRGGAHGAVEALVRTVKTEEDGRISAREVIETGYRLALATKYLEARSEKPADTTPDGDAETSGTTEQTGEAEEERPPMDDAPEEVFFPGMSKMGTQTLDALAHSLVHVARKRKRRDTFTAATASEEDDADPLLQKGMVKLEDCLEWVDSVAPVFGFILPTFLHHALFFGKPLPTGRTDFDFPLCADSSIFFEGSNSPLLFAFACVSTSLNGTYFRLYSSAVDGLSFNRLQNSVHGYGGPTLFLIRAVRHQNIFGAFTATAWKESKDFYGNTDCFLFSVGESVQLLRPTGNDNKYMYCNSTARSRGYDQQAHGLGFGGTVQEPRLFISEAFDDGCTARSSDLTFESGRLLPLTEGSNVQYYFEVDGLEVWGVGGTEQVQQALEARAKARDVKAEAIRRARKVDKAQFLDDFRSGAISSKAFKHRAEIDGRADADVDDRYKEQQRKQLQKNVL
jgi:hypothetical protein